MKIAMAAQMRQIDQDAAQVYGVPTIVLMENAGAEVARAVTAVIGEVIDKKVYIFAGKGNNGGDGYVAARHLYNQGAKVRVFLLGTKTAVNGDARINLDILSRLDVDILEITSERDWDKVKIAVNFADCIIDALLGTGFRGELADSFVQAIELINTAAKPVIAIDLPSGVNADTGQIPGVAVKATATLTLGLPKPGLVLYPGAEYVGKLSVADIGIPSDLLTPAHIQQNLITTDLVRQLLPQRTAVTHKGDCGRVAIVAGSQGLTGAAALTALGALHAGAGLVTLGIAASLHDIMEVKLTEVMTRPLPETVGSAIGIKAVPYIEQMASESDILALGPGLGRAEETQAAVREVVKTAEKPLVLDADALNALVDNIEVLLASKSLAILTPHPGEMARLTKLSAAQINQDRINVARQFAMQWGSIIVLKGARTIVAFPDGEIYINPTGNAGMASGGNGDVLTGIIAAFIGQGLSSHAAAIAGTYVHGMAADIVAHSGQVGMTAGDTLNAVRPAIFGVQGN